MTPALVDQFLDPSVTLPAFVGLLTLNSAAVVVRVRVAAAAAAAVVVAAAAAVAVVVAAAADAADDSFRPLAYGFLVHNHNRCAWSVVVALAR